MNRPVHVINVEIKDNHEEAHLAGKAMLELCTNVREAQIDVSLHVHDSRRLLLFSSNRLKQQPISIKKWARFWLGNKKNILINSYTQSCIIEQHRYFFLMRKSFIESHRSSFVVQVM